MTGLSASSGGLGLEQGSALAGLQQPRLKLEEHHDMEMNTTFCRRIEARKDLQSSADWSVQAVDSEGKQGQ